MDCAESANLVGGASLQRGYSITFVFRINFSLLVQRKVAKEKTPRRGEPLYFASREMVAAAAVLGGL